MIAHSNNFKQSIIRAGRDLKIEIKCFYQVYNLQTEDNKLLITQDNAQLVTEPIETQTPSYTMTEDEVISLKKNNLGELFRSYMKSFDIETAERLNVGDKMIIRIGTTVNNEPEYLDYGIYYVYEKAYNEDTKTFTYTVCDRMLFTMIPLNIDEIFGFYEETTLENLIHWILDYCGMNDGYITYEGQRYNYNEFEDIPNGDKIIYKKTFEGLNITCRDVLDMIMQCTGTSMVVNYMELGQFRLEQFTYKAVGDTSVDTINEDILNTSKIKMTKKFGPLNSLLFSRANETDNIEAKDTSSIEEYGMTRYVIKDNLILEQENRADYLNDLFDKIKGLEYYVCDIDTIGLMYIEYLDRFDVDANSNLYHCLCLKNTGEIDNGMSESFTTEEPKEEQVTYENIGTDDKSAAITMDKLKGEIVLKTYQEDGKTKLAQVRLDSSGEEGSLVEIGADNINLEGYVTANGAFKIDLDGNMECNDAKIIGGNIDLYGNAETPKLNIYNPTQPSTYLSISSGRIVGYGAGDVRTYFVTSSGMLVLEFINTSNILYTGSTIMGNNIEGVEPIQTFKLDAYYGTITANDFIYNSGGYKALKSSNVIYFDAIGTSYIEIGIDGAGAYGINIWASDKRLKDNIEDTKVNALDIINKIEHKEFTYKNDENKETVKIGYVADQLQEIDEQMVIEVGEDKIKQPKESYIIPLLSKAIQEQQEQINQLRKEIEELKGGKK